MVQTLENTTIFHYQLKYVLARGGMSTIYLAHDVVTGRDVAMKLVHSDDHNDYARFQREAKAVSHLKHDHILPAFDYGKYQSWFYMVMPYIEYGTLREHLSNGPLPPQEAGRILTQLAAAVQCAHEQGVIHRDIKPSNVLMSDGEHVYLADFGLVRHKEERTGLTQTGYLIGTPEYMAPEITTQPATPGSDIYALGIVLYQMLTGDVPFRGTTPVAICLKHLNEQPLAPSVYNSTLSPAVDQVVLHALAKDPSQRFQSATELATAYQVAINNIPFPQSIATRKVRRHTPRTYTGLLVAVALLFLLPALFGFLLLSGHLATATILKADTYFNSGHTLTKPPVPHPTTTPTMLKTPLSTQHTTVTHPSSVNTSSNTVTHSNGRNNDKGNGNDSGYRHNKDDGGNNGKGNGDGHGHGKGGDD